MARRVSVTVLCSIVRNGSRKSIGSINVELRAKSFSEVPRKLKRALKRHEGGGIVLATSWHKYKVLSCKAKHASQQQYCSQEDVWPNHLLSLSLKAVVQVSPKQLPTEMRVFVLEHGRWPESFYVTKTHTIRCGCERCQELQANGDAGEDGEGYARYRGLGQRRGYWTPSKFIEHVLGCKISRSRQPSGVPRLRSEDWLTFECPARKGPGAAVKLSVSDLKKEFGYKWQHSVDFPPVPPEGQE